ncbi:hypothetical protein B0H13DRAFT_2059636 [Mycena leptocephala]|nr:hypothetical protein B0H13DRAFT_2059636 [Mycena leptocephala]
MAHRRRLRAPVRAARAGARDERGVEREGRVRAGPPPPPDPTPRAAPPAPHPHTSARRIHTTRPARNRPARAVLFLHAAPRVVRVGEAHEGNAERRARGAVHLAVEVAYRPVRGEVRLEEGVGREGREAREEHGGGGGAREKKRGRNTHLIRHHRKFQKTYQQPPLNPNQHLPPRLSPYPFRHDRGTPPLAHERDERAPVGGRVA